MRSSDKRDSAVFHLLAVCLVGVWVVLKGFEKVASWGGLVAVLLVAKMGGDLVVLSVAKMGNVLVDAKAVTQRG